MKVISIRQPWASLIVTGGVNIQTGAAELKDVENRSWRTLYRGPLLIHASLRREDISPNELERRLGVRAVDDVPTGGIVGLVDLVDCVKSHPSRWHAPGCYGFVLANPRALPFVAWRGSLSLRDAPPELLTMCGLSTALADHSVTASVAA